MVTVRQSLNNSNPNTLPIDMAMIRAGEAFNLLAKTVRGKVESGVLKLPEDQRAVRVDSVYAMGTSPGYKTPTAIGSNTAPTAGQVGIDGAGNIIFAAADGITDAVVVYYSGEG